MKTTLLSLVLGGTFISASFFPNHSGNLPVKYINDTSSSPLVKYGKYVYGRENCQRCHVLEDNTDPKRISLDGLKDKYPESWHYMHLYDPKMVRPDSKMPAFRHLFNRNINREVVVKIVANGAVLRTAADSLAVWEQAKRDAQEVINVLKKDKIDEGSPEPREIIALIAYLRQILPSEPKRIADSINAASWEKQELKLDSAFATAGPNNNSPVFKCATSNNPDTIAEGKRLYEFSLCFACHRADGGGNAGPNLTDDYWLYGSKPFDIVKIIWNGTSKGMPAKKYELSPTDIGKITAYIRSLRGSNPPNAKAPQGDKE